MPVDLNELLLGQQAADLAIGGQSHVHSMRLLSAVTTNKFEAVDLLQAAAAKELGKAGMSTDLAGLRPPALPAVT